jgi:hypothetical protein
MALSRLVRLTPVVAVLALLLPGTASAAPRYPRLHQALFELTEARAELQGAKHDFGGHRKAAVRDIDAAIFEVRASLKAIGDPYTRWERVKKHYEGYRNHPHLRHAEVALREARKELEAAPHDFKGHRPRAVRDINAALRQVEECIRHVR